MKRFITFAILAVVLSTAGFAAKQNDLSDQIAIKGELKQTYENYPAGTPVVIRRVVKMKATDKVGSDIFYAAEINGIQIAIPAESMKTVTFLPPETNQEFWQQMYLKQHLYEYFHQYGYHTKLRQEVDEECRDYLYKLEDIGYEDDFTTSYVQNIFAKLTATGIDPNRNERLNVRVIQSPEPDAYMLPNGTMLISTGLLCTLDSEDELAAVIASEMAHFVLDHQINNIYRAERRAKRAAFWGTVLAVTAEVALDVAYWDDDDTALGVSAVASIGSIAALLNVNVINRLGMKYKNNQEYAADRVARELLAFKGMNPDGLSSALAKIIGFYSMQNRSDNLLRYGSVDNLRKRIEKSGEAESQSSRPYLRTMSDVVTFNAAMNMADQRYDDAIRLVQKNINNNLVSDHDYIILVKSQMALYNTEEVNEECATLLWQARELAGDNPNLDIYKQEILLLMRMNKQAKAASTLKEYLGLLSRYQKQGVQAEDEEWTNKEINWANQLLNKISRL
ncbi:M48 family metallopeptidase [Bacteroides oleiciplenus]|uniref:M48 family metallopeptidase n=1 Tax=Bacteroides oleiciplenus TaxID=626931 RepID=UPI0026DBD988|nr:M48 family metallopeptidase [Bacteroides oleiciplenus]